MNMIYVENLFKEYKLGQLYSMKHALRAFLARIRGNTIEKAKPFRAIDGISLTIKKGEVVGIIGLNGAGKSTLLKLISGITTPTKGSVDVSGSLSPLIEVGAGLHGEMTGRENIFLNAAILGVPKRIIKEKVDDIVEFSELENFVDTPLKRYSSGMKVRLGFSIATSLNADILIVDEVLAVGDLAFQRKCFNRIEGMLKGNDKTVLIVSHNIRQIARLCSRTILLDHGKVIADGPPSEVCNLYYDLSNERVLNQQSGNSHSNSNIRTSGELELLQIDILDEKGNPTDTIELGKNLVVRIRLELVQSFRKPEFTIGTHTTDFVYLTSSTTSLFSGRSDLKSGKHEIEYSIVNFPLVPGVYCIRFMMHDEFGRIVFLGETLKVFSVRGAGRVQVQENAKYKMVNIDSEWMLDGDKSLCSQSPLTEKSQQSTG